MLPAPDDIVNQQTVSIHRSHDLIELRTMLDLTASFLVLTALLAYVNHRFVKLPSTIGVMAIALSLSALLFGLNKLGFTRMHEYEVSLVRSIDFTDVLMQGMLSLLLFAGALHVDLSELKKFRWQIGMLAVFGTLLSTIVVGLGLWLLLPLLGLGLPLVYCLVFGALISPTDPIAVMAILKSAGAPQSVELVIAGESLFNDGVGVVFFALLLEMALAGEPPTLRHGALLMLREAGGGIVFGLLLGYVTFYLLRSIDSYQEEVLITLAAVLGGYALASHLHISGPLAMVVVGLIIGNHGRSLAMSSNTRAYIDMFWELLDAILNSALFVLIGLEVILIPFSPSLALAGGVTILLTLGARLLLVGTVATGRTGARYHRWPDLHRGGVLGTGPGPEHRQAGATGRGLKHAQYFLGRTGGNGKNSTLRIFSRP
jgi:CPA1 family monovalent cation:H+ antiporter